MNLLRRASLRTKLVLSVALTLGVVSLSIIALLSARMAADSRAAMERRARETATMLAQVAAPGLEFEDSANVLVLLESLGAAPEALYAAVYQADGQALASWRPERIPQGALPEAQGGAVVSLGSGRLEVFAPVKVKAGAPGTLRIGFTLDEVVAQQRANSALALGLALALLLAGIGVAFATGTVLGGPIRTIATVARQIAQGDLKAAGEALDAHGIGAGAGGGPEGGVANEVGLLARAFREMLGALRETSLTLQESSSLLGESVEELSSSSASQRESVTRQAAALRQVGTFAQEFKQTSDAASRQANAALVVASRAEQARSAGDASIEQTLAVLFEIQKQVEAIAQKIGGLGERTVHVGGIAEVVKDLADQSNLLALNASIEAARAGEQGRGFAVVALEVRRLADQSVKQTGEVRRALQEIVVATRSAIAMTEEGVSRIQAGVGQAQTSGQSLRELSAFAQESASASREIVGVMGQQNQGVDQVTQAIDEIDEMMKETEERIAQTAKAVDTVAAVSLRVLGQARRFRA